MNRFGKAKNGRPFQCAKCKGRFDTEADRWIDNFNIPKRPFCGDCMRSAGEIEPRRVPPNGKRLDPVSKEILKKLEPYINEICDLRIAQALEKWEERRGG